MGVNPQNPSERIQVPAVLVPKFKAGKALKDALKAAQRSGAASSAPVGDVSDAPAPQPTHTSEAEAPAPAAEPAPEPPTSY